VTVAVPQLPETVTTDGALDVHVNVGDAMFAPLASFATAVMVRVSVSAAIAGVPVTVRVIDETATGGGLVSPSEPPPQAETNIALAMLARARIDSFD
jgi:hypothetical protein